MRILVLISFFLFSFSTHAQVVKTSGQDDVLKAAVNSLVLLLQDNYSREYEPYRTTFDIPDNRKLVAFSITGYTMGNNSYQFLAVFKKSQHQETETSTPYGPIKYKLLGYVQLGGNHVGTINLEGITYEKNTLKVPFAPDTSTITLINSETIKKPVTSVTIALGEHGLRVLNKE